MDSIDTFYSYGDEIEVPDPDTPWYSVLSFALTYNGYHRHGTFEAVAEIADRVHEQWRQTGSVESDLDELRCALFFEQRAYHHTDGSPNPSYLRALLSAIREKSGGVVAGPPDPLP